MADAMMEDIYPARGRAFIRRIETAEAYAGGTIVIPVQAREKVSKLQFTIEALGDYEYCEADSWEDCPLAGHTKRSEHRHRLQVGDWVLCRNRSWGATPDPAVYVVSQRDILGVFKEGV